MSYVSEKGRQNVHSKQWANEQAKAQRIAYAASLPKSMKLTKAEAQAKQSEILAQRRLTYDRKRGIINSSQRNMVRIDMQFFAEKDLENQETASIIRSMRKFEKRISEHKEYIQNPKSHCPEWDNYSENQKNGLIRHWNKEINNFEESIQNRIDELKKRGEYDE